ncbi:MAG TPA: YceI family protein [Thiobacillaceae bacterium]|nr:YceI family protein [Thiobacillaceae bacterium]
MWVPLALLWPLSCTVTAQAVERFTLDPTHTFPSFEIRHQGISTMRGKFTRTKGQVVLDPLGQENRIEVSVDASSVDTGMDNLDQILRGGSFFNVAQYPEVRFSATQIEFREGRPVLARGQLTLLGQTRPMELEIRDYACTKHFLTRRSMCGADVHGVLRRAEYGMTAWIPLVGDEVRLAIEVEGFRD